MIIQDHQPELSDSVNLFFRDGSEYKYENNIFWINIHWRFLHLSFHYFDQKLCPLQIFEDSRVFQSNYNFWRFTIPFLPKKGCQLVWKWKHCFLLIRIWLIFHIYQIYVFFYSILHIKAKKWPWNWKSGIFKNTLFFGLGLQTEEFILTP